LYVIALHRALHRLGPCSPGFQAAGTPAASKQPNILANHLTGQPAVDARPPSYPRFCQYFSVSRALSGTFQPRSRPLSPPRALAAAPFLVPPLQL
ncbi:hypothetical protein, partial [Paraburkholderia ginsengiterrae]|uniref:hypothetical protein n=1 Tax=Paraburkholderia ginsengiterrae TaxID=1462993 RepID=UPI000B1C7930